MLSLLFDVNVVYDLLTVIFIMALIVLCLKNPKIGKPIFGTIVTVACLGLTIYCGINLNSYYGASGGIYGYLTGREPVNVVEAEDFEFKFNNLELLEGDDGKYSATMIIDQVMKLNEPNVNVFLNDMPCQVIEYNSNYLITNFNYVFYNQDMTETCLDALNFRFAFYKNFTRVTIYTEGGSVAVKNWNDFLNANNMVVTIKPSEYTEDTTIDFVNSEVSGFTKVQYFVDGELYFETYQRTNSNFKFPETPIKTNSEFVGWKNASGEFVTENQKLTNTTILTAEFKYRETVDITIVSNEEQFPYQVFKGEYFVLPTQLNGEDIVGYCYEDTYKNLSSQKLDLMPNDMIRANQNSTLYAVCWRPITILKSTLISNFDKTIINDSLTYDTSHLSTLSTFNPLIKLDFYLEASNSSGVYVSGNISVESNLTTSKEGRISLSFNKFENATIENADCYITYIINRVGVMLQGWMNNDNTAKITKIQLINVEVFC